MKKILLILFTLSIINCENSYEKKTNLIDLVPTNPLLLIKYESLKDYKSETFYKNFKSVLGFNHDSISNNFIELIYQSTPNIQEASKLIIGSLQNGKKIMFCGNGGSAADAQHLSAELVGRYMKNRKPLASIALTTDTSVITAISNDFSFDKIFSRQVESIGNEGDILYAISTSGKSENVIAALKIAKLLKIKTIGITGSEGAGFNDLCDITITVPASRPDRIQEMHIAIGHIICEILESELC